MNPLVKYSITFITFSILVSCNNKVNKNLEFDANEPSNILEITIKDKNNVTKYKGKELPEFIDTIWYMSLTDSVLIGEVSKLYFLNDTFFIFDKLTKSIIVVNNKGKLVTYLNAQGKGPEEYLAINDFTVNSDSREIVIHDNDSKQLLYYNFKGEFTHRRPLREFYHCFEHISNNVYAFVSYKYTNECSLKLMTDQNKLISPVYEFYKISFNSLKLFQKVQDKVYFFPSYLRFGYSIEKDKITPFVKLVNNKLMDQNYLKKYGVEDFKSFHSKKLDKGIRASSFTQTENYLYYTLAEESKIYYGITNLLDGESKFSDFFPGLGTSNNTFFYNNNTIISWNIPHEKFLETVKKNPENYDPFFSTIEDNLNPFLIFTKLK